jgi:hypothetical protein
MNGLMALPKPATPGGLRSKAPGRRRWRVLPWWQANSTRDDVLGTYVPVKVAKILDWQAPIIDD